MSQVILVVDVHLLEVGLMTGTEDVLEHAAAVDHSLQTDQSTHTALHKAIQKFDYALEVDFDELGQQGPWN